MSGLTFPPVGGKHQKLAGDMDHRQGPAPSAAAAEEQCEILRAKSDEFSGSTTTVTYERTDKRKKKCM